MALSDYTMIGPLAYQGKEGCEDVRCGRMMRRSEDGGWEFEGTRCRGWHCSYCDAPCGSMGHGCDASKTILAEARRLVEQNTESRRDDA